MESVIDVRELTFSYGAAPVLEDVSFSVRRGDFVCMIGPNGGGKTTLLRLMLGLLTPQRGTVRVLGRTPVEARRRLGYMPQYVQLDPQFPVRVRDVVRMGRIGHGLRSWMRGDDRRVVDDALAEVRLSEFAHRPLAALSGGQRQRVLIARALACEPEVLLLDEPTANLDPLVQDEMTDLLKRLNERLTIVVVSHDVGFVARQVKSVVCVNRHVETHAATDLTGESIREMYGQEMRLVRHAHDHDHGHDHAHPHTH